jgi:hypothetical protein
MDDIIKFLLIAALILLLIAFGPLVTIWALNTLFGLKIAFTFWTWFATLWIQGLFVAGSRKSS